MKRDLAREIYKAFSTHQKKNRTSANPELRERVDDPRPIASILNELVEQRDWKQGVAEGTLFTQWSEVVGDEIAEHTTPISIAEGHLTIQASSTAWASQLTVISQQLLASISKSAPGALVESISIVGPNGPTWKRGVRTIRNARGPRDTYG
jgi:predicted nucleic acid-binding Zn ribbon protein